MAKIEAFGKPEKDGTLEMPYDKVYDTTHLAIWTLKKLGIKSTERNVVVFILVFQIIISVLVILGMW